MAKSDERVSDIDPERRGFIKSAAGLGGAAAGFAVAGLPQLSAAQTAGMKPGLVNTTNHYYLPASAETVHWGYFSKLLPPLIEVDSGDFVTIETLTHHANDDAERMIHGDPGAESVYHWTADKKNVDRRGAGPMDASVFGRGAGEGFGVHILTGPVAVRGAEPGDLLEVRILDVHPRPSAIRPIAARRSAAMPRPGGASTTTT